MKKIADNPDRSPLKGKVALVAGATRGAGRGIAVELGAAGATVYATGRTTRLHTSEYGRPETIEETVEIIDKAGGKGIAVQVDHLKVGEVEDLVGRIRREEGRLDILVNDIWGGELLKKGITSQSVWEHDLSKGLHMLELAINTHLITAHYALPLMIQEPGGLLVEVTDGTYEYNSEHYRISPFYDLCKWSVLRLAWEHAKDLEKYKATSVCVTPGWMRSEMMLEVYGVTETNWRDAVKKVPGFAISETPRYIGRAVSAMAADPDRARWNGSSTSSGDLAQIYGFTDIDGSQPDCWGYMRDEEEATKTTNIDDYR